jgi:DHA1 family tetracycline resistance protein-like MFS transporter
LFLIVLIDAFSVTIIIPLLPYYATAFGLDIYGLGILLAISPVVEVLSRPMYKIVSKRLGRRPVLIVSQLGTFAGFLLLGGASAVWMLFLARIIDGIASANNTLGRSLVRDSLTPSTRTQGMGMVEAAYSLGFLAGPLVGLITLALTDNDYRMVPYVAAVISLVAVILSVFTARETLPPEKRKSSGLSVREKIKARLAPLRKPVVFFLLVIFFMVQFSYIGFLEFYGLLALNRLGMNAISTAVFWLLGGVLAVIVGGGIVGKLSQRFSDRLLVLAGLGLLGAGLIFSATTPAVPVQWYSRTEIIEELSLEEPIFGETLVIQDFPVDLPPEGAAGWLGFVWFLLALILIIVGSSMLIPAVKSMLLGSATNYRASSILSVSGVLYKSALIVVPLVMGFSFLQFGLTVPFLVEGVILLVLLLFAFRWLKTGATKSGRG